MSYYDTEIGLSFHVARRECRWRQEVDGVGHATWLLIPSANQVCQTLIDKELFIFWQRDGEWTVISV